MFKIPIPLKAIPMVLDDSFTPAELLTKITFKINEIIEATNTLQTDKVDIDQGVEKAGYFLKVNQEGKVVAIESGGVMANWGDIGGNIVNQTDLINLINAGLDLKLDKTDVENSLTSDSITKALSAYQGKVLKQLIDAINNSKISVNQGTENAGKFLRVDAYGNVLPMDSSGGSINWGDIIGNITQQTDLMQKFSNIENDIGNIENDIGNIENDIGNIENDIGNDIITEIGNSITNAIANLFNGIYYTNGTYTISGHLFGIVAVSPNYIFGQVVLNKNIPTGKTITINNYALTLRNEKGYIKFKNASTGSYQNIGAISKEVLDASMQSINISIANENKIYIILNSGDSFKSSDNQNVVENSFGQMQITNINFTIS